MIEECRQRLRQVGQEHLLQFADELSPGQMLKLLEQIKAIDFDLLERLHAQSRSKSVSIDPASLSPMEAMSLPRTDADRQAKAQCAAVGLEALLAGRVAAVLVAGGQGSRLGFEHPKGMFPIGPVTQASLFQFHAERILARSRQSGKPVPWYIMTSPTNDQETRNFFASKNNFGLGGEQVRFFTQGTIPAIDAQTGKVLLADRGEVFVSPNGHGGTLLALREHGMLDDMAQRGCDTIFYFQVDNPFVDILDPTFIGFHLMRQADISIKVLRKAYPKEKLGLVIQDHGKPTMIEYSDLPDPIAHEVDEQGDLRYWTGSIAIHVFRRTFLERVTGQGVGLPYHIAHKKVPFIDPQGQPIEPREPNAIKFETFIFDSLPLADRVAVMETSRTEEYEPVKNADGDHSPDVVKQAITRRAGRWLTEAGISYPTNPEGEPAVPLEISPLAGLSPNEFRRRVTDMRPVDRPTAWTDKGRIAGKKV
ncbi:UDPGP type 1 family protein [bacterium]|nr:UDPGP type 1 family protein [bacterium]